MRTADGGGDCELLVLHRLGWPSVRIDGLSLEEPPRDERGRVQFLDPARASGRLFGAHAGDTRGCADVGWPPIMVYLA